MSSPVVYTACKQLCSPGAETGVGGEARGCRQKKLQSSSEREILDRLRAWSSSWQQQWWTNAHVRCHWALKFWLSDIAFASTSGVL